MHPNPCHAARTLCAVSVPRPLERLSAGQPIVFGGDRVVEVGDDLAAAFRSGDRLVVVQETGDLLHVPAADHAVAATAVTAAGEAFAALARCTDDQITEFYDQFARRLADDASAGPVLAANVEDVNRAEKAGRSTTRLVLSERMRQDMVDGLRSWRDADLRRDVELRRIEHDGWSVEARRAPLGVVGFVFEGRPNVFADATGVLRTGNTVVMRIGSDALATADAIVTHALDPALVDAGLPPGTVSLVRAPSRAAGWAMFADQRLALAVARGSGAAVAQLGAVARQAGTPVSLHGTGGAWIVAGVHADRAEFRAAVVHSLDRKVCNTLNVCCIPADRVDLVDVFLDALDAAAAARDTSARLHVEESSRHVVAAARFDDKVAIRRADGDHVEPAASVIGVGGPRPGVGVGGIARGHARGHGGRRRRCRALQRATARGSSRPWSATDVEEVDRFYAAVDAPFVGDGFTRWVDGQYALDTPELGLANWQGGRLLARGAILSGDSVHTVRHRARVDRRRAASLNRHALAVAALAVTLAACSDRGVRTESAETDAVTAPTRPAAPEPADTAQRPDTAPTVPSADDTTGPTGTTVAGGPAEPSTTDADVLYPELGSSDLDVQSYDVAIAYDPSTQLLQGTVTITTLVERPLAAIALDATDVQVDRVAVDGIAASFEQSDSELIVRPPAPVEPGQSVEVAVTYHDDAHNTGAPTAFGSGWYPTADGSYVINEPDGARTWLPSNDHPSDKATWRFEITVPDGLAGVANGDLVEQRPGDGSDDMGLAAGRADGDVPRPAPRRRLRRGGRWCGRDGADHERRARRRPRPDAAVLRHDRRPVRVLRAVVRPVPARPVRARHERQWAGRGDGDPGALAVRSRRLPRRVAGYRCSSCSSPTSSPTSGSVTRCRRRRGATCG